MTKVKIKLESTIDLIPYYRRKTAYKYFEFKILFIRLVIENLF